MSAAKSDETFLLIALEIIANRCDWSLLKTLVWKYAKSAVCRIPCFEVKRSFKKSHSARPFGFHWERLFPTIIFSIYQRSYESEVLFSWSRFKSATSRYRFNHGLTSQQKNIDPFSWSGDNGFHFVFPTSFDKRCETKVKSRETWKSLPWYAIFDISGGSDVVSDDILYNYASCCVISRRLPAGCDGPCRGSSLSLTMVNACSNILINISKQLNYFSLYFFLFFFRIY